MRIAFITQCRPSRELGGARAQLELKPELEALGCRCDLVGPEELAARAGGHDVQAGFERWLVSEGRDYDVVDYDHNYVLPERSSLPRETLHVARSVLFLPFVPLLLADDHTTVKQKLLLRWQALRARRRRVQPTAPFNQVLQGLRRCDALNVSSTRDEWLARALGLPEERVVRLPFALGRARREELRGVSGRVRRGPRFVFVGTYDTRKGGPVLPRIWRRLSAEFPEARLSLLGVKGSESEAATLRRIRGDFGDLWSDRVTVRPVFANEELPELLGESGVGLFPSRHEGFGFAVLEQLAAGVPVVAYDAPGPCDLLPADWRTPTGEPDMLAARAAEVMRAVLAGGAPAARAVTLADQFRIEEVAAATVAAYARARRLA